MENRPILAPTRPLRPLAALLCLLFVVGGGPSVVHAKRSRAKTVAKRMERAGRVAYKKGDYADAILAFEAANDAVPKAKHLYNLARCHEKLGHLDEAVDHYERFLQDVDDGKDHEDVRTVLDFLRLKLERAEEESEESAPSEADTEDDEEDDEDEDKGDDEESELVPAAQARPRPGGAHGCGVRLQHRPQGVAVLRHRGRLLHRRDLRAGQHLRGRRRGGWGRGRGRGRRGQR